MEELRCQILCHWKGLLEKYILYEKQKLCLIGMLQISIGLRQKL